ncbi:kinase-like protein [Clavulina sp. PMI_390]|nr:kinase-like protein [Clavulina sp. PMI_390]
MTQHPRIPLALSPTPQLHVTYPNTYPHAPAKFRLSDAKGLSSTHLQNLATHIKAEALKARGEVMVLIIANEVESWIANNNLLSKETQSPLPSLAAERTARATEKEKDLQTQAEQLQSQVTQRDSELAVRIQQSIQQRKEATIKQDTERNPPSAIKLGDFDPSRDEFEHGLERRRFKLSFPRQGALCVIADLNGQLNSLKEGLCTTYFAEPDTEGTMPELASALEVHHFEFNTNYYANGQAFTKQGWGKLNLMHGELKRCIGIEHPHLITLYSSRLYSNLERPYPILSLLGEQTPTLSLHDLLTNCDALPLTKVKDLMTQILQALQCLHAAGVHHRSVGPRSVFLARESGESRFTIKLGRQWYLNRIQDVHTANRFGSTKHVSPDTLPDSWLPPEVLRSRYEYSRRRDVWSLAVVVLQMAEGLSVVSRYSSPSAAVDDAALSHDFRRLLHSMLQSESKGGPTCEELLRSISQWGIRPRANTLTQGVSRPISPGSSESDETEDSDDDDEESTDGEGHAAKPQPLPALAPPPSRYQQDWTELELIIKKVRLRGSESKMKREVTALSRLSHVHIVRYFTTWIETSTTPLDLEGSEEASNSRSYSFDDDDYESDEEGSTDDDLDPINNVRGEFSAYANRGTFPALHADSSAEDFRDALGNFTKQRRPLPLFEEILYIQMEYVENKTLIQAIEQGISEERAWILFRQILDALKHIESFGIIHRDIKPGNIFIDLLGNVKVGDFGLASTRHAITDGNDGTEDNHSISHSSISRDEEFTSGVGTGLYIAPEVLKQKPGQTHSNADIYSLGIVFFEMNMPNFGTNSERVQVLSALRTPQITFPHEWPSGRVNQRKVLRLMLQHNPGRRPTAAALSQNELLPKRMDEDVINEALQMLANPESGRYNVLLDKLFTQPVDPVKVFSYDAAGGLREYAPSIPVVREAIVGVFHLHGAVEDQPPLLTPLRELQAENKNAAPAFLDRQGDLVALPSNVMVPLARSAALGKMERIKRFYTGNVYQSISGQPEALHQAGFDIISTDVNSVASETECILVMDELLRSLPGISNEPSEILISHSDLTSGIFDRVPPERRRDFFQIIENPKTWSMKKMQMLDLGVKAAVIEDAEILLESRSVDELSQRLAQRPGGLGNDQKFIIALQLLKQVISHATVVFGVRQPIILRPFLLCFHQSFSGGIVFELRARRRVLARGGRYDRLIDRFRVPSAEEHRPIKAIGLQVVLEQLAQLANRYTKAKITSLAGPNSHAASYSAEKRSYGTLAPRRCDVYVVSTIFKAGTQRDAPESGDSTAVSSLSNALDSPFEGRMRLVSTLWRAGISADFMYDDGEDKAIEAHLESCLREGILFVVWETRHGTFKAKSVLRGTETEEQLQNLVPYLVREIAEQKRIDFTVAAEDSGAKASAKHAGHGGIIATANGGSSALGLPVTHSYGLPSPSLDIVAKDFGSVVSGSGGPLGGVGGNREATVLGSNIQVILPGDRDAQKRKMRAKNAYYDKGA